MFFKINKFFLILLSIVTINSNAFAKNENQVVTVKMMVKRGDIINSNNLKLINYRRSKIPADIITKIDDAVNLQALRHLRPGMVLRFSYLRKKPLVSKNKAIKIIYNKPGISLESTAKALQDGNKNDIIKVQNLKTNKIINATVIKENTVSAN